MWLYHTRLDDTSSSPPSPPHHGQAPPQTLQGQDLFRHADVIGVFTIEAMLSTGEIDLPVENEQDPEVQGSSLRSKGQVGPRQQDAVRECDSSTQSPLLGTHQTGILMESRLRQTHQ
jgi:hypothetical protein